jgi:hypothetical protein
MNSYEWYPEDLKKKNIKNELYFADSCESSKNRKYTLHSKNKAHKTNTKRKTGFLPMSGSELHYDPKRWNEDFEDRINHNCYAYFLNDLIKDRPKRPQPGHTDPNITTFRKQDYTREEMTRRAIYDNSEIYCVHPDTKCKKGYYKGVLVIDRYNNYHWLIQNSNGYWSHKPGQLDVTNIDASGHLIKDPRKANLLYDDDRSYTLLYSDIGPFFCVPNQEETGIKLKSESCEQCGGAFTNKKKKNIY